MAWIKRNLVFVIGMAAGLLLTGYCAWLFTRDLAKNSTVDNDLQEATRKFDDLANNPKVPEPSQENIQRAIEESNQVKQLVDQLHTAFPPFPAVPKLDVKGFSEHLETTLFDLRTRATNAGVSLPDDFAFAFTEQRGKLNYPLECIPLWLQQLAEINSLCDILYRAKINSLLVLRRVSISSSNDLIITSSDRLDSQIATTPFGTATPYKIEIKCFSKDLAAVLDGLARCSHCFVVKNIVVRPAGPRTLDQAVQEADEEGAPPLPSPPGDPPLLGTGRVSSAAREAALKKYNAQVMAYQRALDALTQWRNSRPGGGGPVTVEREQLLYITISLDEDKFK